MNSILRSILIIILAVFLGLLLGGILNMALILASGYVVPLPDGVDSSNVDSIRENIHLFEAKNYIMPFLAHALGTLLGAYIAARITYTLDKPKKSWLIAGFLIAILFMIGGIQTSIDINAPATAFWVDTLLAYVPFAILGMLPYWFKKEQTIEVIV